MSDNQKKKMASWAVNFETEPSDFDFEVVLGGVHEDREQNSIAHGPGETKGCHVWIHRPAASESARWRQLEITSDRTGDENSSDRVEYDLASECQEQLAFALALYSPHRFVFVPWEHRLQSISGVPETTHRLSQDELTRFRGFAGNLRNFFTDRVHFVHARAKAAYRISQPDRPEIDADAQWWLGMDSRSSSHVFLRDSGHVLFGADLFEHALRGQRTSLGPFTEELRLVLLSAAAEALFTNDNAEIGHKLALRMAMLNGQESDARREMFDLIKKCYGLRSQYVHGAVYRGKKLLIASRDDVDRFANLVRASLLYFIALSGYEKDNLLARLDDALFSPEQLSNLRTEANWFWGLGDSDAERLHAADWTSQGAV